MFGVVWITCPFLKRNFLIRNEKSHFILIMRKKSFHLEMKKVISFWQWDDACMCKKIFFLKDKKLFGMIKNSVEKGVLGEDFKTFSKESQNGTI